MGFCRLPIITALYTFIINTNLIYTQCNNVNDLTVFNANNRKQNYLSKWFPIEFCFRSTLTPTLYPAKKRNLCFYSRKNNSGEISFTE